MQDDLQMSFIIDGLDFKISLKVLNIRTQITPSPAYSLFVPTFNECFYEPIMLPASRILISSMKPSGCPNYVLPAQRLSEIFPTVASYELNIINNSLVSGKVPSSFKHAVIQPLWKKLALTPWEYPANDKNPFFIYIAGKGCL